MTLKKLAKEVILQAQECDLSIVTAESCTAGTIAKALSEAPGAGDHLEGGFVVYTKGMKNETLSVPKNLLRKKSAVCAEVAQALAWGALKYSPADVAVAVTGVAGPKPDEDGNPVGLVYCCAVKRGVAPIVSKRCFRNLTHQGVVKAAARESLLLLKRICKEQHNSKR